MLDDRDFTGINLSGADLRFTSLKRACLKHSRLERANLSHAILQNADLSCANLFQGILSVADLTESNLSNTVLREANLMTATLSGANLSRADLMAANLTGAKAVGASFHQATLSFTVLVHSDLTDAKVVDCNVDGIAASNLVLRGTVQANLRAGPIQVDSLELVQFLHLMLGNGGIRQVIETISSNVVLILGRFPPERMTILYGIWHELRKRNYVPVLFSFGKPSNWDITETVSALAHMARFIIADITDAKRIPQTLMQIVPALPMVPVQPLVLASQREYGMFEHFRRFPWVLEPFMYSDRETLLALLNNKVIGPAEARAKQQTGR